MTRALGLSAFLVFLAGFSTAMAQSELPVLDQDFACITEQKAQQYRRDFNIDINSFGGLELCKPTVDTKKLFNDLRLIEEGAFGTPAGNNLIRGFIPIDRYYAWMKSATRGVDRGQDVPYATAYNRGGYFTMQDGWAVLSTLGRVGTIVHEARHTEGYYHIACNQGPYAGARLSGCDQNYDYAGSHAIEMEYYARVSVAGKNFHPVYKKMARLMAMGRSNFVFNQTPLRQREALMAMGRSGQAYLFDQGRWVSRETPLNLEGARLKRTSFGAALMLGTSVAVLDPFENSGFNWAVNDDFSYFKLLHSDRLSGETVRDFEEFDINRKRYVFVLTESGRYTNFNFPQGSWNRLMNSPIAGDLQFATTSPDGKQGLFLVDSRQNVYSVDAERPQSVANVNATWPREAKSFARAGSTFYQLNHDGTLLVAGGAAAASPEALDQIVAIPLYDSFEVKP